MATKPRVPEAAVDETWGESTRCVHLGEPAVRSDRSLSPPIVLSSAFPFKDTAELHRFMQGEIERPAEYGRYGNPTVRSVEERLAALDGAQDALLYASGMAAITGLLSVMLRPGQGLVMTSDVYRKTRHFARTFLERWGVKVAIVEPTLAAIANAISEETRLVLSELPTNPYLRVVDLEGLSRLCKSRRVKLVVDATFATPINLRPLELGADLVVHSATKYLGGHNDLLGGVLTGKSGLVAAMREHAGTFGALMAPQVAWLLGRGLKTLALRVRQQNASAFLLAGLLAEHPAVEKVWYPLHPSHPDHALAQDLLGGGGGVLSFELKGGLEAGTRLCDRVRIPKIAPSLGGSESLIEQPALMSFYELSPEQRESLGIRSGLVRLAVGLEDGEDLARDMVAGLDGLMDGTSA